MPYEVKPDGDGFAVVNTATGEKKAHHNTKEKADAQVRLLHAIEHDPRWQPTKG